jgi:hypothetical protein
MILLTLASCRVGPKWACDKWKVQTSVNNGPWYYTFCDSMEMKSKKEIDVWISGHRTTIHADMIVVSYKPCQ